MKKLILLVMTLIIFNCVIAAPDTIINKIDIPCSTAEMVEATINKYGEKPMLTMVSNRLMGNDVIEVISVMFVNPKTQSYTLVEKVKEDLFCVISMGNEIKPYIQ